MSIFNKILVPVQKPPKTYLSALNAVGLDFDCRFSSVNANCYKGLLLTGGGDVFPHLYGKNIHFRGENAIRDLLETELIDKFYNLNLPILGICRGMQLLNVYFGGTLKNVDNHAQINGKDSFHLISADPNGFLKGVIRVNSAHRQAVDLLCPGARVCAVAQDETVEAFTVGDKIIAVQFHPERMGLHQIMKVFGLFAQKVLSN